jgi:hypothetical protein
MSKRIAPLSPTLDTPRPFKALKRDSVFVFDSVPLPSDNDDSFESLFPSSPLSSSLFSDSSSSSSSSSDQDEAPVFMPPTPTHAPTPELNATILCDSDWFKNEIAAAVKPLVERHPDIFKRFMDRAAAIDPDQTASLPKWQLAIGIVFAEMAIDSVAAEYLIAFFLSEPDKMTSYAYVAFACDHVAKVHMNGKLYKSIVKFTSVLLNACRYQCSVFLNSDKTATSHIYPLLVKGHCDDLQIYI